MNNENELLTSDNVSLKDDIKTCKVVCIFLDIRNSTQLNESYDSKELYKIYSKILNDSYSCLEKNGFKNIEIQGDGIYGLFPFENNSKQKIRTIIKCIKEIEKVMHDSYNCDEIKSTLSIRFGKEWYSAFGKKENNKKTLAFFGNVVSKTKKANSLAINGKIVIAKSKFSNDIFDMIKNEIGNGRELYLRNGKIIGQTYLIKWNDDEF